jgi:hypothetical protein
VYSKLSRNAQYLATDSQINTNEFKIQFKKPARTDDPVAPAGLMIYLAQSLFAWLHLICESVAMYYCINRQKFDARRNSSLYFPVILFKNN